MQARHENNKEDLYPQLYRNGLARVTFQLLASHSHDKSKGLGDGGIGLVRWFKSIHECNSRRTVE